VRYCFIARNCRAAAAVALNVIYVLDERAMTLLTPLLEIVFQIRARGLRGAREENHQCSCCKNLRFAH
jgi:hypothetical protein